MESPARNSPSSATTMSSPVPTGIVTGTANTVNDSFLHMDTNVWFETIQEDLPDIRLGDTKRIKVFPDEALPKYITSIPKIASKIYEGLKKKNLVGFPKNKSHSRRECGRTNFHSITDDESKKWPRLS